MKIKNLLSGCIVLSSLYISYGGYDQSTLFYIENWTPQNWIPDNWNPEIKQAIDQRLRTRNREREKIRVEGKLFYKLDFSDMDFSDIEFDNCFFVNVDFSRSNFQRSFFNECEIRDCILSSISLCDDFKLPKIDLRENSDHAKLITMYSSLRNFNQFKKAQELNNLLILIHIKLINTNLSGLI